ncbi:helix-turn-helix domain-containing protein [Streptomyces sp. WM6378]|uniref:helix-turn-helix domain-containing protein n=1 Tax=Streptomyces sp. WM6378 TaxID=1415557 RepID=UPI0006AFC943|nr:helix-turn-helix domain-containing protein [Streptomyces sp. WM6378]KOU42888.1 AraC family transcriptional regulator [Streptomyces sp. WM6378]
MSTSATSDGRTVALAVAEGSMLFEAAAACEVFGTDHSELVDPWYSFRVCGSRQARVGGWLRADTTHGLDALVSAHTVIVPAQDDIEGDPPGELIDAVRAAHAAGARMVSLCTGAFVLAAAGLLDGRRATTHWAHAELLAARYPRVTVDAGVLFTDEADVLTSAGKAAGMDLCLHIVRSDHGATVANALARHLVVPPHRDGGQAQFIPAPVTHGRDHPLADLLPWALDRLDQPLTVEDLARQAAMSSRNLARHFHAVTGTSPLRWLLSQRVRLAQELLESGDDSVEHIAARTGMGTSATLRRHFARVTGLPPEAYRRTFGIR